jgi:hypothetical protein
MRKDSLLQSIHKAAAPNGTPSISPISLQKKKKKKAKENVVLISLNRWGMVVVGLGASLKGENQIWSEKEYFFTFKL